MSDRVLVTIRDGIADVRFNRADKRNTLDADQFIAIADAGERLKSEPGVRVVVLSGEGESFCAGLDFSIFGQMAGGGLDGDAGEARRDGNPGRLTDSGITHLGQQVCWVWQELEVPVIAAMRGHALGGGLQIALGRGHPHRPSRHAAVGPRAPLGHHARHDRDVHAVKLVRNDIARELTYTARVLDAREGHALGLVTRLSDDPYEAAMALASEIAARNPHGVRGAKALFNRMFTEGVAEQFEQEREVDPLADRHSEPGRGDHREPREAGSRLRSTERGAPDPGRAGDPTSFGRPTP